jgi:hypothetical protein
VDRDLLVGAVAGTVPLSVSCFGSPSQSVSSVPRDRSRHVVIASKHDSAAISQKLEQPLPHLTPLTLAPRFWGGHTLNMTSLVLTSVVLNKDTLKLPCLQTLQTRNVDVQNQVD